MADGVTQRIDIEAEDEADSFFDWAGSVLDELAEFVRPEMPSHGNRGPLGGATSTQTVDPGTLVRSASRPPAALTLEPIPIWGPVEPAVQLKQGELKKFVKKFELGPEVYDDLGLAGQIAKKFLKLPYRTGKIVRKRRGRYELVDIKEDGGSGGGLVCSSFANIFGALWFAEDRTNPRPVRAMAHSVHAHARPSRAGEQGKEWKIVTEDEDGEKVLADSDNEEKAKERARLRTAAAVGKKNEAGEMKKYSLSAAQVYASMHGGSLVSVDRLRLDDLIEALNEKDKEHLYAVVKYRKKRGKNKGHIFFLIYSKLVNDWVMIHSPGGSRASGGKGAGPGIYKVPRVEKGRRKGEYKRGKWYQAFDWGRADKPTDTALNSWHYVP